MKSAVSNRKRSFICWERKYQINNCLNSIGQFCKSLQLTCELIVIAQILFMMKWRYFDLVSFASQKEFHRWNLKRFHKIWFWKCTYQSGYCSCMQIKLCFQRAFENAQYIETFRPTVLAFKFQKKISFNLPIQSKRFDKLVSKSLRLKSQANLTKIK